MVVFRQIDAPSVYEKDVANRCLATTILKQAVPHCCVTGPSPMGDGCTWAPLLRLAQFPLKDQSPWDAEQQRKGALWLFEPESC